MTDTKAIENLNKLISEVPGIQRNSSEHTRWLANVLRVLDEIFGADSQYSTTIRAFPWKETGSRIYSGYDFQAQRERDHQNAFRRQMEQAKGILQSAVDALTESVSEANEEASQLVETYAPKKVFIVHGHAEAVNQEVARTIEKLGLEAIILREQPNTGKTIIEKFEEYAKDVNFAVILLTADDKIEGEDFFRARQNVVFEMGYFMGALGRRNVMCILQENVEKPGDIDGVVYTIIDKAGGWKYSLIKELKACGYDVDANKVL